MSTFGFASQNLRIASYLHRLGSILERGADHMLQEEMRLTFMQVMILMVVQRFARANQKEIVRILGVTPGAVSRQLDSLVADGYVARAINARNRRQHLITLTRKGTGCIETAFSILDRSLTALFDQFPEGERNSLEATLRNMVRLMEHEELRTTGCDISESKPL